MNKKNRFSMLEVEVEDSNSTESSSSKRVKEVKHEPQAKGKRPTDIKVIVHEDDFKNNLEKHKLKNQKKGIEKQKIEIKHESEMLKKAAYFKIYLGIGIIAHGLIPLILRYIINPNLITDLNVTRQVVIIAVGVIVQSFLGKKKGKSK